MKTIAETKSFCLFDNSQAGLLFDDSKHKDFPIRYYNWINGKGLTFKDDCSYYIYVYGGAPIISGDFTKPMNLFTSEGMFASFCGEHGLKLRGIGQAVIIEVLHTESEHYLSTKYRAQFHVGALENEGRLKYIDGCTDSLLIPPVKMGDPCFNHLHFPAHISQTQHTHPSNRIGIVSKGSGLCLTPFGNLPLDKGNIFIIKEWDGETFSKADDGIKYPNGQHSFETYEGEMDVVAFHPDSDFGATDVDHPMINRTIVDGKSASELKDIRTK